MDAFYLEMRLSNDPDMGKHAEDYNLMVLDMVKISSIKTQNAFSNAEIHRVMQQIP